MSIKKAVPFLMVCLPILSLLSCAGFLPYPREVNYNDKIELQAHVDKVLSVSFSPDDKYLASGGADGLAKIWNVESRSLVHNLVTRSTQIFTVAFSPDGKMLATGSNDSIQIWSVETGTLLHTKKGHPGEIYWLEFSPDGTQLVSAGPDPNIRVWDAENLENEEPLFIITGHNGAVYTAKYSRDGKYILSTCFDKTLRLTDAETGLPAKYFSGHAAAVLSATFNNAEDRIASIGKDKTIRVWKTETGEEYKKINIGAMEEHNVPDEIWSITSLPQSENIVVFAGREGYLKFWNILTRKQKRIIKLDYGEIWDIAVSSTGQKLALACEEGIILIYTLFN